MKVFEVGGTTLSLALFIDVTNSNASHYYKARVPVFTLSLGSMAPLLLASLIIMPMVILASFFCSREETDRIII